MGQENVQNLYKFIYALLHCAFLEILPKKYNLYCDHNDNERRKYETSRLHKNAVLLIAFQQTVCDNVNEDKGENLFNEKFKIQHKISRNKDFQACKFQISRTQCNAAFVWALL
ncbi:conserved hypothetical protein [Trichinella spiralis]|uniref:hypothetical protein n=1 Tax=Trichinella spiralis TaxID=6334 RepID=UPI0001EFCAD1|nr:conserved hypothetical protein [Trichinella spiralis]